VPPSSRPVPRDHPPVHPVLDSVYTPVHVPVLETDYDLDIDSGTVVAMSLDNYSATPRSSVTYPKMIVLLLEKGDLRLLRI